MKRNFPEMTGEDITAILLNDILDNVLGKESMFVPEDKLQSTVIKANLKAAKFKSGLVQVKVRF